MQPNMINILRIIWQLVKRKLLEQVELYLSYLEVEQ